MEWLHLLPSVRVSQKSRLPECPGIYLFSVGRSIYYVGKALNIRERHSSESNHDAYSNFYKTAPNLRKLFCIKWLPFTGIAISGYLLDQLLLGYEDYLIKNLCPLWNKRQNGTDFSDDLIHSILNKIMNTHFPENTKSALDSLASIYPDHQLIDDQECQQITYSDEILAKTREYHATRKESVYKPNNGEWANLKDNTKIQDLFSSLNAYSGKPISPAEMVLLGFKFIAQHLNNKGLVMETTDDFSILENFRSEIQCHPKLLVAAKASLEEYPNMSFEELVLRCTAKSVEEISPLDAAMLRVFHTKCDDPMNLSVDIIQ
jgi:hypothetical protein